MGAIPAGRGQRPAYGNGSSTSRHLDGRFHECPNSQDPRLSDTLVSGLARIHVESPLVCRRCHADTKDNDPVWYRKCLYEADGMSVLGHREEPIDKLPRLVSQKFSLAPHLPPG
jgi:hypothetical protein